MPKVHNCFCQDTETLPPSKCINREVCRQTKCSCRKCRCRKHVTNAEAQEMIRDGSADWLILELKVGLRYEPCPLCQNDETLRKVCLNCDKTGRIKIPENEIIYDFNQLVSTKARRTPRTATIERAHIIRAYVNLVKEDKLRIEEYGRLNAAMLNELIVPFIPDPWEGRLIW